MSNILIKFLKVIPFGVGFEFLTSLDSDSRLNESSSYLWALVQSARLHQKAKIMFKIQFLSIFAGQEKHILRRADKSTLPHKNLTTFMTLYEDGSQ